MWICLRWYTDKRDGSEGNGIARFAPERPLFATSSMLA